MSQSIIVLIYLSSSTDPPKRLDGESPQITIFGLKLGDEGRLNVTVRAMPPPAADWTVGDQRLVAPQQNADASAAALQPVPLVSIITDYSSCFVTEISVT